MNQIDLETIREKFIKSPLARKQYAKNAKQLQGFADIAKATGKKHRGQTAAYWQAKALQYLLNSTGE